MAMPSGEIDSLYAVLESVIDMTSDDRSGLAELLKYTSMSNITKTIAIIKDRLEAIQRLKHLVLGGMAQVVEADNRKANLR